MQARFIKSAAGSGGFPDDVGAEVVFAGRSNSGKSSAINRITGQNKLARVSKTPGRTQLINFFELADGRRLVDLPGYGFARVPDAVRRDWQRLIEAYFSERHSMAGLFLTADIRRGLVESDTTLLSMAEDLGIPVAILLTKADKLSRGQGSSRELAIRSAAGSAMQVMRFSALDGTGVTEARNRLVGWLGMEPGA